MSPSDIYNQKSKRSVACHKEENMRKSGCVGRQMMNVREETGLKYYPMFS